MQLLHHSTPSTQKAIVDLYREAVRSGMSVEDVQRELKEFDQLVDDVRKQRKKDRRLSTRFWRVKRILPVILITVGSVLVANAVWPILFFTLFVSPSLQKSDLSAPVPEENVLVASQKNQVGLVQAAHDTSGELVRPKPKPVILDAELDYSNLANWFKDSSQIAQEVEQAKQYTLDIPELNIHNAIIKVGGVDLNNSLIQYPGTADPGEFGAPVIFGHSVLRQFYNPTEDNPRRYHSIFSKIMTLKKGDQIYITYDGVKYTYTVQDKKEVDPEDTYILEQRHSLRQLKLITCVPEGTFLHRGVVLANLDKIE